MEFNTRLADETWFNDLGQAAEDFFKQHTVASRLDREAWDFCGNHGALKTPLPKSIYEGRDLGLVETIEVFEHLGSKGADPGLMFALGAHLFGCTLPVSWYAKPAIQEEWGLPLATGKSIGALAVTEPSGGSNLAKMNTSAEACDDGYVINGKKTPITNAPDADVFLTLAATKPGGGIFGLTAFLIPRDAPGLSVEPLDGTLGLRGAPMGSVIFDNCKTTEDMIIGSLNAGFRIFTKAMLWERTGLLSGLLGASSVDLDKCVQFANAKDSDRESISSHQGISHRLANMKLRLESARMFLYRAAWSIDNQHKDANTYASMAKHQASEAILENALDSMRIQAGSGWVNDKGTAVLLKDSIGALFASGTSEIQLNIIAASLGLKRH